MNPESQTKNFRGFVMSKKLKKHGYAERLKYMHMLENGYSREYIHRHYGISSALLGYLWSRYKSEGSNGLLKKQNVRADYKPQILGRNQSNLWNKYRIFLYCLK